VNNLVRGDGGREFANDCLSPDTAHGTPATRPRTSLAQLASQLSERDLGVLVSLDNLRLLTARQVERLHFHEGSPLTQARRARKALARLHHLRLVHRFERRIGGMRSGSSGYIYGLAARGQRLLLTTGPAGDSRRRRPWEPSAHFQDHVLAVAELCVRLHEATWDGTLELLRFEAEPTCWRTYTGLGGGRMVLKPDAFVLLAAGDFEHLSFVEVDRSTEGTATIKRKLAAYENYLATGQEQSRHDVFPQVVFLVPDERRRRTIEKIIRSTRSAEAFLVGVDDFATELLSGGGR